MSAPRRHHIPRSALWVTATFVTMGLVACGPTPAPDAGAGGPGGSGVVTAEPPSGPATVNRDTACDLIAQSPTLDALGAVGEPADTTYIVALSYCQLALTAVPGYEANSISVEVLAVADVIATAELDPAAFTGTLLPLSSLGENGHFVALTPGVDPASNPTAGAITASKGELGVTISWATRDATLGFSDYEQVVRELLEVLP